MSVYYNGLLVTFAWLIICVYDGILSEIHSDLRFFSHWFSTLHEKTCDVNKEISFHNARPTQMWPIVPRGGKAWEWWTLSGTSGPRTWSWRCRPAIFHTQIGQLLRWRQRLTPFPPGLLSSQDIWIGCWFHANSHFWLTPFHLKCDSLGRGLQPRGFLDYDDAVDPVFRIFWLRNPEIVRWLILARFWGQAGRNGTLHVVLTWLLS